jgi:hypothetical protein
MSATTIRVPATQVESIRASLFGRRDEDDSRDEIAGLLGQLGEASPGGSCRLTGPRSIIWSAVYDSLCQGAEQLADECNDLWRREADPGAVRAGIADVSARLELLVELGSKPPG